MSDLRPAYPKRPPFFALKFTRLLAKACVANTHGPDVFTLLAVIAGVEDAKAYRSAVTFFNGQLMPLVGKQTTPALIRVRDKAIASGWLHYEPGGKSVPGKYWVIVPPEFARVRDNPTDENPDEYSPATVTPALQEPLPEATGSVTPVLQEADGKRYEKRTASVNHSSLPKKPIPKAEEPAAAAAVDPPADEPVESPAKKPRTPQPIDPLFEGICDLVGNAHRVPSGSRIARIARDMLKAGLTRDQLRTLPAVVAKYQSWRTTIDLNTVAGCWPWILTPPTTTGPPRRFRSKADEDTEFMAEQFASVFTPHQENR